jgi:hypothetical protein
MFQRAYQILDELNKWASEHQLYDPMRSRKWLNDLRLSFYATHLAALSILTGGEEQTALSSMATDDARIACALLLMTYGSCDASTAQRLAPTKSLLTHSTPIAELDSTNPSTLYSDLDNTSVCDLSPLYKQNALERFPIHAFFILARGLATSASYNAETDLELLQRVLTLFCGLAEKLPRHSHIQKVASILSMVLEIVHMLQIPDVHSPRIDCPFPSNESTGDGALLPFYFLDRLRALESSKSQTRELCRSYPNQGATGVAAELSTRRTSEGRPRGQKRPCVSESEDDRSLGCSSHVNISDHTLLPVPEIFVPHIDQPHSLTLLPTEHFDMSI